MKMAEDKWWLVVVGCWLVVGWLLVGCWLFVEGCFVCGHESNPLRHIWHHLFGLAKRPHKGGFIFEHWLVLVDLLG